VPAWTCLAVWITATC